MKVTNKVPQNELDNAAQAGTAGSKSKHLAKPYPKAFQELLDGVANGEDLPPSVLDQLEKNAKMLIKHSIETKKTSLGLSSKKTAAA
jgi:hypothetical protein